MIDQDLEIVKLWGDLCREVSIIVELMETVVPDVEPEAGVPTAPLH